MRDIETKTEQPVLEPISAGADFYRRAMRTLKEAGVPFLIGGTYAFTRYTGIVRPTKDIDIFLKQNDIERALNVFEKAGYRPERPFPHWLAKAYCDKNFIDLIFSSANGIAVVDDEWFEYAVEDEVLGLTLKLCPPEETIWSKAFIMEKERFDGADIAHLIRYQGDNFDWKRLLRRFDQHWRVLLSHLILYGFIYPTEREKVPGWVMSDLLGRLRKELKTDSAEAEIEQVCQGTILSRQQYLHDIQQEGFVDARLEPLGSLKPEELAIWTAAIGQDGDH